MTSWRRCAPAYDAIREAILGTPGYPTPADVTVAGDAAVDEEAGEWADAPPRMAAEALLAFLDEPSPPMRKVIGNGAYDMVRMALEARRDDYLRDPAFGWPGPPED
jgi:hypothetical protein